MAEKENKNEKQQKLKQAIALEYNPEEDAPRVIASGRGALAERIIEKAQESNVPIHRDDKLADTLSRLDIGEMIPPELYEVVAEILIFVDSIKFGRHHSVSQQQRPYRRGIATDF